MSRSRLLLNSNNFSTYSGQFNRQIEFSTLKEAIEYLNSLGEVKERRVGMMTTHDTLNNLSNIYFYEITTEFAILNYTVTEFENKVILSEYKTNLNKMVLAAENGDLATMIENFTPFKNIFYLSIEKAILNDRINILNYLRTHYNDQIDKNKISLTDLSLKFGSTNVLNWLLESGEKLPNNWLSFILYHNKIEIAKYLFDVKRIHNNNHSFTNLEWLRKLITYTSYHTDTTRYLLGNADYKIFLSGIISKAK